MANLTFNKIDVNIYAVHNGLQYKIDTSEINFGQTFQEKSYKVKTLHNQSSFEGSVINKANPAEWSLDIPLLEESRNRILFDRLLDSGTFDLYISSQYDVWKLEKCIIQNGSFQIKKSEPLRLSIEGEASKLSKFTSSESNINLDAIKGKRLLIVSLGDVDFTELGASRNLVGEYFTATGNLDSGTGIVRSAIPGTPQGTSINTYSYIVPRINTLTLGGVDISNLVVSLGLELQNNFEWNKYDTIQGAVEATNAETSMYPSTPTQQTRVLGGSIRKYLEKDAPNVLTWSTNTPLVLKAWSSNGKGITLNISNCSFTNRMSGDEVFTEEYSWRMTQNPTSLSSVLTYVTN